MFSLREQRTTTLRPSPTFNLDVQPRPTLYSKLTVRYTVDNQFCIQIYLHCLTGHARKQVDKGIIEGAPQRSSTRNATATASRMSGTSKTEPEDGKAMLQGQADPLTASDGQNSQEQPAETPYSPKLWEALIDRAENSGDPEKIKQAYESLLEHYPNNVRFRIILLIDYKPIPVCEVDCADSLPQPLSHQPG